MHKYNVPKDRRTLLAVNYVIQCITRGEHYSRSKEKAINSQSVSCDNASLDVAILHLPINVNG